MSEEDPRRAVHYSVGRLGDRFTGGDIGGHYASRPTSEDPGERQTYAFAVAAGWAGLMVGGLLLGALVTVLVESAFGDPAARVATALFVAAAMFCNAGLVNATWRALWFAPKARRRARKHGPESAEFQQALAQIPPRNSSLICQAAVGILTFVIAIT